MRCSYRQCQNIDNKEQFNMANGTIDKFMGKCNKQLQAVGSIKRKLIKTRSLSTSTDIVSGFDSPDLDHLLENTDQVSSN